MQTKIIKPIKSTEFKVRAVTENYHDIITVIPENRAKVANRLNLNIGKRNCSFLIDTGASVSLIKRFVLTGINYKLDSIGTRVITGISGQPLPIIGTIDLSVSIGMEKGCHKFVVCEDSLPLSSDGIIGLDFLEKFKAVIDISGKVIWFGKIKLEIGAVLPQQTDSCFTGQRSKDTASASISVAEDFTVSTQCETEFDRELESNKHVTSDKVINRETRDTYVTREAKLRQIRLKGKLVIAPRTEARCFGLRENTSQRYEGYFMVEPADVLIRGVLVARVLVPDSTDNVNVVIANVSDEELIIPEKTILGYEVPVSINEMSNQKSEESIRTIKSADILEELDLSHLDLEDRNRLLKLIDNYRDIFKAEGTQLGCTSKIEHHIITEQCHPIAKRPYRVPHAQKKELTVQIEELLRNKIIEESNSPWSAPVVMVNKIMSDGSTKVRLCIDFRALNNVTKKDFLPLPNLQDTIEQLNGAALFTTLDLASGYHQVAVAEEDKEKTAFSTPWGHYQWNRMPFGLCNAPSTFQRLMYCVLSGLTTEQCFVYLDDIIVFSKNDITEHLEKLKNVFERLRVNNLKLKTEKCQFMKKETGFLGHVISREGVKPDPEKTKAIEKYPKPKSVRDIKAFLGLVGFYRRFINNFAHTAKPLTLLTKKDVPFNWTEETENAFDTLRTALLQSPVLLYPNFEEPFILSTDASNCAIGAILSQKIDGHEHPISYASRTLNTAERNYSTTEKECLAVVWAVKFFRCYLYGRQFTVITDHRPLRWLMALTDPSSRLARWALTLSEYEFQIIHRPGREHGNDNALSRITIAYVEEYEPIWNKETIMQEQLKDSEVAQIIKTLSNNEIRKEYYQDNDEVLYKRRTLEEREDRLVVPASMKKDIFKAYHDLPQAGHMGFDKTLARIKKKFFWKGMSVDIKEYCAKCLSCSQRKTSPHTRVAPLQTFEEVLAPFDRVSMDIVGPLTTSKHGNKYILTFQDAFTRFPEAVALPDQKAETIAKVLVTEIIARHGTPKQLLTDKGANFLSEVFKNVCKMLGIKKLQTTAYHPMCNGRIERFHRTLADCMSHYVRVDQRDWDTWLPYVLMAIRNSINAATGETPFFMMYGRELELPFDERITPYSNEPTPVGNHLITRLRRAHEVVRERLRRAHEKNAAQYNKKSAPVTLKVGDQVLLHDSTVPVGLSKKLLKPWIGPFVILKQTSPVNFIIKDIKTQKEQVVHANRLKLCLAEIPETENDYSEISIPVQLPTKDNFIWPSPPVYTLPEDDAPNYNRQQNLHSDESSETADNHSDFEPDTDNSDCVPNGINEPPNDQPRYFTRSNTRPPELPWISNSRI